MAEGSSIGGIFGLAVVIVLGAWVVNSCNSGPSDSDFIDKAHSAVTDQLKSPSTASWCNDDTVGDSPKGDGGKIVTGCVNAQNSFGATVEVDYAVYEDSDANVLDVESRDRQ